MSLESLESDVANLVVVGTAQTTAIAGQKAVLDQKVASAIAAAAATQVLRDSIITTQGSIGYLPPVAYAAGLSMTLPAQTVSYSGQAYAPLLSMLPFVTNGTFETAKFRLIQGVSGADLATPDGAALVGGVNPIYVLKNHRLPGDSDSAVINKALRKIELDALPGSRLQFECGRTYTYDSTHSLGLINDLDIDLNGALLKRADSAVTKTTLAASTSASHPAGATVSVAAIPANWAVGDLVAVVINNTYAGTSSSARITALNRTTNVVTLNASMTLAGYATYPAGTVIAKGFSCFGGRPSNTDTGVLLAPGSNKRIRIHGGTIDGNAAQQVSNSWTFMCEIFLMTEGGAIYDMKFQNTPGECIVGHGFDIGGGGRNTFVDLCGSAVHLSCHDETAALNVGAVIRGNLFRRTNTVGQTVSGHAEGVITFSWGPGNLTVAHNFFDGAGSGAPFGSFKVSSGSNPSMLLTINANICKNYSSIFYAFNQETYGVTVNGNSFHNCGNNAALVSAFFKAANTFADNSASGNTVLTPTPITPTVFGSTGAGAATYSTATCDYSRIGNRIFFDIVLIWSGHTGTGFLRASGLPVLPSASSAVSSIYSSIAVGAGKQLAVMVNAGTTNLLFYQCDPDGGITNQLPMSASGTLRISGNYAIA